MKKFTKQLFAGVIALGMLTPIVTTSFNPINITVNAKRHHKRFSHYKKIRLHKHHYNHKHHHNKSYKSGWNNSTNHNSITAVSIHNVNFYKFNHNKSYKNGVIAGFKSRFSHKNAWRLLRNGKRFAYHHHVSKVGYDGVHHKWIKGY